ncbi:MAG: hypothetical protein QOK07_1632, partial [Gemmatimonadaceae bacterium]|nr:hypothetical protein [Gemmatimonadaceae bacterium]
MTTFNLTCEAVEATLPDYLDETLEAWVRKSIDDHLSECARCAGLLRDLRSMEREAAALPALTPSHDLWPEVAHDIGALVVASRPEGEPLGASSEPPVLASASLPISEPSVPTSELPLPTPELSLPAPELGAIAAEPDPLVVEPEPLVVEPEPLIAEPAAIAPEPTPIAPEPTLLQTETSQATREPPVMLERPGLHSEEAPVTAIAPAALPGRRQKRWGPPRMGLAAAALVLVTAGTTFLMTVRWLGPARTPYVAPDTANRRISSGATSPGNRGIRGRSDARNQIGYDSSTRTPPPGP